MAACQRSGIVLRQDFRDMKNMRVRGHQKIPRIFAASKRGIVISTDQAKWMNGLESSYAESEMGRFVRGAYTGKLYPGRTKSHTHY